MDRQAMVSADIHAAKPGGVRSRQGDQQGNKMELCVWVTRWTLCRKEIDRMSQSLFVRCTFTMGSHHCSLDSASLM